MLKLIARLFGVKIVESPEAIRITVPKWMTKAFPGIQSKVQAEIEQESPYANVRIVGRSIIRKF